MIEDIKFLNRKTGTIEVEKVYGEKWLKLIYGSPLGKFHYGLLLKELGFQNGMVGKWIRLEKVNPKLFCS